VSDAGDVGDVGDDPTAPGPAERALRTGGPHDPAALIAELDALRELAVTRWRAITALAPAAKRLRLRSQALARGLEAIDAILAGGEQAVAAARAAIAALRADGRDKRG
jgi:hypothetical protein